MIHSNRCSIQFKQVMIQFFLFMALTSIFSALSLSNLDRAPAVKDTQDNQVVLTLAPVTPLPSNAGDVSINATWAPIEDITSAYIYYYNGFAFTCGTIINVKNDKNLYIRVFPLNNTSDVHWYFAGGSKDDQCNGVCGTGNIFYTIGSTKSGGNGGSDLWLVKWNISAYTPTKAWEKTFGGSSDDYGNAIWMNSTRIITCGSTNSFGAGQSDMWVAEFDLSGNLQWNNTLGDTDPQTGAAVTCDGIYVYTCGNTFNLLTRGDIMVGKLYAKNGTIITTIYKDFGNRDDGRFIWCNSTRVIFGGSVSSVGYGLDFYVSMVNSNLGLVWDKIWNIVDDDVGNAIAVNNSRIYITGYSHLNGVKRIWTTCYYSNGSLYTASFILDPSQNYEGTSIYISQNRYYIAGIVQNATHNFLYFQTSSSGSRFIDGYHCSCSPQSICTFGNVIYTTGFAMDSYPTMGFTFLNKVDKVFNTSIERRLLFGNGSSNSWGIWANVTDVFLVGAFQPLGGGEKTFLARFDSSLNARWNVSLTLAFVTTGFKVVGDGRSAVYIAGKFHDFGPDSLFVAKYLVNGTLAWSKILSAPGIVYYGDPSIMLAGGAIYMAATSQNHVGAPYYRNLMKFFPNGTIAANTTETGHTENGLYSDGNNIHTCDTNTPNDVTSYSEVNGFSLNCEYKWTSSTILNKSFPMTILSDGGLLYVPTQKLAGAKYWLSLSVFGMDCRYHMSIFNISYEKPFKDACYDLNNLYVLGFVAGSPASYYKATLLKMEAALPAPLINANCTKIDINKFKISNGQHVNLSFSTLNGRDDDITSWIWNLGNGTTSTQASIVHQYWGVGNHHGNLTITDTNGETITEYFSVYVNAVPIADFTANRTRIIENYTVKFTFTGSVGNGMLIFTYNFGDGSYSNASLNPVHVYAIAGIYYVCLQIYDIDFEQSTLNKTGYITVEVDTSPVATITANATRIIQNQQVQFNYTGTSGSGDLDYRWNFGDMTGNSSFVNPVHTFVASGTYSIILTVNDWDGDASTTYRMNMIVVDLDTSPVSDFVANLLQATQEVPIQFSYVGTAGNGIVSYQWNFGDGMANATVANPIHIFMNAGNYTITLSVVDANGNVSTMQKVAYISIIALVNLPAMTPTETLLLGLVVGLLCFTGFTTVLVLYLFLKLKRSSVLQRSRNDNVPAPLHTPGPVPSTDGPPALASENAPALAPSPSVKFAASSSSKPAAKPTSKPAAKQTSKPAAKPASKPAAKPASKPAAKPASKPAAKPASKPVAPSSSKPASSSTPASSSDPDVAPRSRKRSRPGKT